MCSHHHYKERALAIAIALADTKTTGEAWPELLGVLFQLSQSDVEGQRESAFRIFTAAPTIIEKQHEAVVLEAFATGFKDAADAVKIAAVEAFSAFFRSIQ
ncbi:MAG: hypothetical protein INR71_06275, partial [Terriglobus roseus]|nr:hypothetical protein [Terriglobus roseus]